MRTEFRVFGERFKIRIELKKRYQRIILEIGWIRNYERKIFQPNLFDTKIEEAKENEKILDVHAEKIFIMEQAREIA
jgi:hypothetical protein